MNKREIKEYLKKYKLDSSKYIVISGAAMVLQGFKETANDIDIAVDTDYYNYLLNNYDCKLEENTTDVYYIDNVINFGKLYYDKDKIYIDNIPVQTVDNLIKLKKSFNREKDIKDLALIDKKININSLALAYLGDGIYEIYIRKYLLNKGIIKVNELQKESIKYVSAKNQALYLKDMLDNNFFTEEEVEIIKRARNHKSHSSKSTDIVTYKHATALEALIGYLEITNNKERINDIMDYILEG